MSAMIGKGSRLDLFTLLEMDDPDAVFEEVLSLTNGVLTASDRALLKGVFADTVALFEGRYPGYRACTTGFHDLRHTTDVLLALGRIVHGYGIVRGGLTREAVLAGLLAALLHDSGYIQRSDDLEGTGGKFTLVHLRRSKEFMRAYMADNGHPPELASRCERLIAATEFGRDLSTIPFATESEKIAGGAIFAADLLGQMADRTYLEKLLFLYAEYSEAGIIEFQSEYDLLHKTIAFYEIILRRLESAIGDVGHYLRAHFLSRHAIDKDLYLEYIGKNVLYLEYIVEHHSADYRSMLRRGNIVRRLEELETARV